MGTGRVFALALAVVVARPLAATESGIVTWIVGNDPGCGFLSTVAVSADGSSIAMLQCVSSFYNPVKPRLYVVRRDGTGYRKVSTLTLNLATFLRISNGGEKVAYISGHTFDDYYVWSDVYVVDVATGTTQNLTGPTGGHLVDQMDLNADGSKIVFDRYDSDPAKFGTFVVNSDGTGEQKVFAYPGENSISGDGSTVAVSAWIGGERKLYVMGADGSNVRLIATPEEHDTQPWLDHDGSVVTFLSYFESSGSSTRSYLADTESGVATILEPDVLDAQVCGDGSRVLIGTLPPGAGTSPPARIHADGSGKEVFFPCGGSFYQRRICHDGSLVAVVCALTPGVESGLQLADWNLPNLKLVGRPKVGAPISLVLNGTAGRPFVWFLSLGAAALPVPPYGTLGLDPATMGVLLGGVLDGTGRFVVPATLPPEPALIGAHAYLQAVTGDAPLVVGGRFTNTLDLAIEG